MYAHAPCMHMHHLTHALHAPCTCTSIHYTMMHIQDVYAPYIYHACTCMHMQAHAILIIGFVTDATVSVNESEFTVTEGQNANICIILQSAGQILISVTVMLESGDLVTSYTLLSRRLTHNLHLYSTKYVSFFLDKHISFI